jgi:aldehyde dehydrogenase (NAD+)
VTVLIPYHHEEEAIRIANDTSFGLAGTVFTADVMHGFAIARRIRAGTFDAGQLAK